VTIPGMSRLRRAAVTVSCLLALTTGSLASASVIKQQPSGGQPQDVPTQVAAMNRLNFMLGRWKGSGWIIGVGGVRQDFDQTEVVTKKVQGTVMTVDGEGRDPADAHRIVDSALAVVNYNDTTQQFRWEAFSQGFVTDTTAVVGDHTFQWSLVETAVTIRYSLTFTNTAWHEIGEVTTDGGQTWHQNFQMDLCRS
jgi:hypothetical protein